MSGSSGLEDPLDLLLLTVDPHPESVLLSLSLLLHTVRSAPTEVSSLLEAGNADVAIVDARTDLAAAADCVGCWAPPERSVPVVAVVNEGGLVAVSVEWGLDEILLPAPVRRDRRPVAVAGGTPRRSWPVRRAPARSVSANWSSTRGTYTARLRGRRWTSPTRNFELLKYLAQHAGGCSPARSCCRRSGATTSSAAPHGRRARAAVAGQARHGIRIVDRHGPQRRL